MRPWKDFLIRWVMVFLIGALGVTMCYRYVDIPLARFAHQHDLRQYPIFHALQALSDGLLLLTPVVLLAVGGIGVRSPGLMGWRCKRRWGSWWFLCSSIHSSLLSAGRGPRPFTRTIHPCCTTAFMASFPSKGVSPTAPFHRAMRRSLRWLPPWWGGTRPVTAFWPCCCG